VQEIIELHNEIIQRLERCGKDAIRIGELLTMQKQQLKHGEWLPWVRECLPFSHDTATNYMKLYEHRAKLRNVRNLSQAYQAIRLSTATTRKDQTGFKHTFLRALKTVMIATDSTEKFDFGSELVTFTPDGRLSAYAYYSSMGITFPINVQLDGSVNGTNLLKFLTCRDTSPEITLTIQGDMLVVDDGLSRLRLPIRDRDGLEGMFDLPESQEFEELPDDFMQGLALVAPTAAPDIRKGFLRGVYVGSNQVLACDNFRVSRYVLDQSIAGEFLLSRETALKMVKTFGVEKGMCTHFLHDSRGSEYPRVHFKLHNGGVFSTSVFLRDAGTYPHDTMKDLVAAPGDEADAEYEWPEGLLCNVEKACCALAYGEAPDHLPLIELSRDGDRLLLWGMNENTEASFEAAIHWSQSQHNGFPENTALRLRPFLLMDFLKRSSRFSLANPKDHAVVVFRTDKFSHALCYD